MDAQELLLQQLLQQNLVWLQRYLQAANRRLQQSEYLLDERTVQDATIIVEKLQKEISKLRHLEN